MSGIEQSESIPDLAGDDSVELIYEEIKWALEFQRDSLASIEGKAATLMGFSGAILALILGSLETQIFSAVVKINILSGVVLTVLALLLGSLVFWSKRTRLDPSPKILLTKFHKRPRRETQLQVAVNRVDAFEDNQRRVERAAVILRIAMAVQALSIIPIAVAVLLLIIRT